MNRADLHSYQRRAVAMMLSQNRMYLAIGMGLGKTVSALTGVVDLKASGVAVKCLVIAPKRVAESVWAAEAGKWEHLSGLSVRLVAGSGKDREKVLQEHADVYVIGRDNVAWLVELGGWDFNLMIIDEASSFKDPSSKRFKMLKRVSGLTERCWLLSGTPGDYLALWPQYYLLDGGQRLGRTITAYRQAYFDQDYMGWNWTIRAGMDRVIQERIKDITVSMQAEDYLELPERIDRVVSVDLGGQAREAYEKLERDYLLDVRGEVLTAANAAVLAGKLLQLSNGAVYAEDRSVVEIHDGKLDALTAIVESADAPLLVFYLFKHDLSRILKTFPGARKLETDADVADWNAGKVKLMVAHPASCGHGLNLQGCRGASMVWFGLPWSLELYEQANARIHRQGVVDVVVVHHLVTSGSIDEDVLDVLKTKGAKQAALLESLKRRVI